MSLWNFERVKNAIMHFCVNNLVVFGAQLERDYIEVWQYVSFWG